MSLLLIVPTRGRPANCKRLIQSFRKTADNADMIFVTDADDDSYEEFDWKGYKVAQLDPRPNLVQKLNMAASNVIDDYDYLMWTGDDHVFTTKHWDTLMLDVMKDMGGHGWVYPENGRRADVPETWMVSSELTRELGYFAMPALRHFYIDNCIAELGRRTSLIRYARDVKIEHRHYSIDNSVKYDETYREAERNFAKADLAVFNQWRNGPEIAAQVSMLRRKFSPDVAWVLSRL